MKWPVSHSLVEFNGAHAVSQDEYKDVRLDLPLFKLKAEGSQLDPAGATMAKMLVQSAESQVDLKRHEWIGPLRRTVLSASEKQFVPARSIMPVSIMHRPEAEFLVIQQTLREPRIGLAPARRELERSQQTFPQSRCHDPGPC